MWAFNSKPDQVDRQYAGGYGGKAPILLLILDKTKPGDFTRFSGLIRACQDTTK